MKHLFVIVALFISILCYSAEIRGTVTKVVDGDTFVFKTEEGDKFRVRMAHIDAPESSQPFGDQSKTALATMIDSQTVYIEFHSIDTFGRIVGIVYKKKVFGKYYDCVNKSMVQLGWAYWFTEYSKDLDYCKLQEEAKEKKLGVWSSKDAEEPWVYRKRIRNEKKNK